MKVFLSWWGERSKAVAQALREFLPAVIQRVEPFMSDADIGRGERWLHRLTGELESQVFGILCVTPECREAPWIMFEAGGLAKSVEASRVVPYLFHVRPADLPPCLAQFQAKNADQEGSRSLVESINSRIDGGGLPELALENQFNRVWPEWEARLNSVPDIGSDQQTTRSDRELLEEILTLLRPSTRPTIDKTGRKAIVVDCEGGSLDGECLIGDPRDGPNIKRPVTASSVLWLTNNGQIGKRLVTATPKSLEILYASSSYEEAIARREELDINEMRNAYEVVGRYEYPLVLYIQIKHVPGFRFPTRKKRARAAGTPDDFEGRTES